MKDLSIEEKAKAYDIALERAKEWSEGKYGHSVADTPKDIAEYLFPELAESDDEKTRKQIMEHIMWSEDNGNCATEEKERWIAWLEKQGEQKSTQETEPTPIFRTGDVLKRKGKDYTFIVDRIQGGYYHCDRNHGAFFPVEEQDNWELIVPKPAEWSIFDYRTWQYIVSDVLTKKEGIGQYLDDGTCKNIAKYMQEEWSKKLSTEQKPVWSEEDDKIQNDLMWMIEAYRKNSFNKGHFETANRAENWLKSLKDRVQPQPKQKWKPSDEQMGVLLSEVTAWTKGCPKQIVLESLYNDLKKLKEL